jgi:hypothetical protein
MEPDERECPFCAEIIKAKAKICKHCGSNIDPSETPSSGKKTMTAPFPEPAPFVTASPPMDVESQIRALGEFDRFGTRKEIKCVPEIIRPGERIMAMTSGLLNGTTWLIIATDQRVVFLDKGMFFGLKQLEIPLKAITAVVQIRGLIYGGINITAASVTHSITMIAKKDVKRVCDTISGLIQSIR